MRRGPGARFISRTSFVPLDPTPQGPLWDEPIMQEIAWRIVYPARPYAPRRCKVTPTYRQLPLVAGAHESERPARKVITLEQLTHYDTSMTRVSH